MGWAAKEFEGIDLGDERLDKRAVLLAERLAGKPMVNASISSHMNARSACFARPGASSQRRRAAPAWIWKRSMHWPIGWPALFSSVRFQACCAADSQRLPGRQRELPPNRAGRWRLKRV